MAGSEMLSDEWQLNSNAPATNEISFKVGNGFMSLRSFRLEIVEGNL
jgi:hypothetical protein